MNLLDDDPNYGPWILERGRMHRLTHYGASIDWRGVHHLPDLDINEHLKRWQPLITT